MAHHHTWSTPVILEVVLTQTFIPDTLDSVPQAITSDTTPDTTLDTTLVTTQDTTAVAMAVAMALATAVATAVVTAVAMAVATAVAILADRFVIFCFRIHNRISTIYLSIIYHSLLRSVIHFLRRQREKGIGPKKAN